MVLVPDVVDAVAPTPVLAAGGIGDGRQMAAAFALGAQGVWTGSVWLTTEEAETHPTVKQKFLAAGAGDTVRSRSLTGKPARQLRSDWTDAWDAEWTATRNGEPAAIVPTDGLFRGVVVPEGSSEIVFRYVPASFHRGLLLSIVASGVWGVLLWRTRAGRVSA